MPRQGKCFVRKQEHGESGSHRQHKDNGTGHQSVGKECLHLFTQPLRLVHCLQTHNQ